MPDGATLVPAGHPGSRHIGTGDGRRRSRIHARLLSPRRLSYCRIVEESPGIADPGDPGDMEMYGGLNWIPHVPGQLARREVAGYRIFDALGAGARVPPTALVTGPHGPGMAQLFVPMKASKNRRCPHRRRERNSFVRSWRGAASRSAGDPASTTTP